MKESLHTIHIYTKESAEAATEEHLFLQNTSGGCFWKCT